MSSVSKFIAAISRALTFAGAPALSLYLVVFPNPVFWISHPSVMVLISLMGLIALRMRNAEEQLSGGV